jgi:hypothetical protein
MTDSPNLRSPISVTVFDDSVANASCSSGG